MVIEEPIPVPSWLETTSTDYKLIDFDRGAIEGTTMAVDRNTVTDGSTSVLTNLFSSGQTSTWSSLLVTALSENLTTFMNNTELLGPTASFDQAQRQLIDSGYTLGRCDNGSEIFNCTAQEYMEYMRGPQTLPLQQAIFVTIVYVLIFLTGVIGNVIVCVVIVRHSTMHTATNYYLFSLAVSDLLFLLMGVPNEVALYWRQYPYVFGLSFCKMRALISEASTYVSVLTIVAFTMERFLAICHPLHLYTMSGFKRALRIIAALWCVSFLSAIPFAVYTQIDILTYPADGSEIPDSAFCAMLTANPGGFPLWEVSTCVFFVIPMTVIMVLYVRIGLRIRSRTKHTQALGVTQGSLHGESRQTQSRKAIIRMLAAVVITFFVFWAPFHAQRLLFLYGQEWDHYKTVNEWLFLFGGTLYYVSCTINPILYNVMSHRYRVAFKETLCGRRHRSYFHTNGFLSTNQSSFRETNHADVHHHQRQESSRLLRIKSVIPGMRCSSRLKDRVPDTTTGATLKWRERINIHAKDAKVIKEEKIPLDNSRHKSDVMVVLENNRNGRTKCYSTSAAALNGPKKTQSPISEGAPELPPLIQPIVEESSEVRTSEKNGASQQTNGQPLAPPFPIQSTILETAATDPGDELATPTMDQGTLEFVSSGPTLLDMSGGGGGCTDALAQQQQPYQRNETSI